MHLTILAPDNSQINVQSVFDAAMHRLLVGRWLTDGMERLIAMHALRCLLLGEILHKPGRRLDNLRTRKFLLKAHGRATQELYSIALLDLKRRGVISIRDGRAYPADIEQHQAWAAGLWDFLVAQMPPQLPSDQ